MERGRRWEENLNKFLKGIFIFNCETRIKRKLKDFQYKYNGIILVEVKPAKLQHIFFCVCYFYSKRRDLISENERNKEMKWKTDIHFRLRIFFLFIYLFISLPFHQHRFLLFYFSVSLFYTLSKTEPGACLLLLTHFIFIHKNTSSSFLIQSIRVY